MTIQEAIKSGKKFKRKLHMDWFSEARFTVTYEGGIELKKTSEEWHPRYVESVNQFTYDDVMAEDWETLS